MITSGVGVSHSPSLTELPELTGAIANSPVIPFGAVKAVSKSLPK
ncbi:MAG: hypothetical protein ORN26_01815 [Candidatus Pacebacteria bacterium]|nr:hypothetical protein [Candidatus Paceibacterota bacterium]